MVSSKSPVVSQTDEPVEPVELPPINSPYVMNTRCHRVVSPEDMEIVRACELMFTEVVPPDKDVGELRRIFGIPPSTEEAPNIFTSCYDYVFPGWSWKINFPKAIVNGSPSAHCLWVHFSVDESRNISTALPYG